METKKQLVARIAEKLHSFGYRVFIAHTGEYGFFTDGNRVVSFGGTWNWSVDFSGNYRSKSCGSGWQIEKELCGITQEQADSFIRKNPPHWETNGEQVKLTTLDQHLCMYQSSSKYTEMLREAKND